MCLGCLCWSWAIVDHELYRLNPINQGKDLNRPDICSLQTGLQTMTRLAFICKPQYVSEGKMSDTGVVRSSVEMAHQSKVFLAWLVMTIPGRK